MSIASAILAKQQQVADAYTAISNKGGTLPATQDLANMPTAINTITTGGTINSLNVTPSTSAQTITATGGVDGYSPVTVNAVTSAIDNNIVADNIKDGVTILGVLGTYVGGITPSGTINITINGTYDVTNYASAVVNVDTVNNTNLSVTPLTTAQSFTVSAPYTGYYTVSVSAVTASIDSNIKASNIKSGISILGVNGSVVELNADSVTINPSTSSQTITPTSPVNGFDEITVNPVTSSIDANISAGNIKSGVSILGVSGTVTELVGETQSVSLTDSSGETFTPSTGKNAITSITVTPNNQARTVTPSTSQQTLSVNSGYSGNGTITVDAVTSSIDADIVAGNIKSGVNILGVNGTLTPVNNDTLSITPSTSSQSFTPTSPYTGYGSVDVSAVTASIDANIQPENIKKDVVILGTTGTYEGSTNIYPPDVNYIIRTDGTTEPITKGSNTLSYTETTIGNWNFTRAYQNDTTILGLILNSITTINTQYLDSMYALYGFCSGASNLKYVYFKNLQTISGEGASATKQFSWAFQSTNIEEISFDSLNNISVTRNSNGIFQNMCQYCAKIKDIYFKALNSTSFGSYNRQFKNMLYTVTGCTVHFPSNLQSVIGSWSDVTAGFGGTNTTVLFDLTATT